MSDSDAWFRSEYWRLLTIICTMVGKQLDNWRWAEVLDTVKHCLRASFQYDMMVSRHHRFETKAY
jgi:hypothetical protein